MSDNDKAKAMKRENKRQEREKKLLSGLTRKDVWLKPQVMAAITKRMGDTGCSANDAINDMITEFANLQGGEKCD